jgi:hypothetical protein
MVDLLTVFPDGFLDKLKKLIKDDKNECKHEHYRGCVRHCEEMSWHVYGEKPERLLKRTRPREDPAITQYRIDSYEPITKAVCKKALSICHKIFDSGLYSIRFSTDANSELLKEYTTEKYPRFNSVVNYLANFILKKMIADPNAIILVQPYEYNIKGSDRVNPIATCYESEDVYLMTDEYVLLFDEYIESKSKTSAQVVKRWFFTYADKTGIYKFSVDQKGGSNPVITYLSEYIHNFGEIPIWYLGGEYSEDADDGSHGYVESEDNKDEEPIFESFFHAAVPFWNEAINDHSDVTGAYRMHMWPQKWEVADECEYVEESDNGRHACNSGYIFDGTSKHKCPGCKGTGYKSAKSPYETHLINRDKFGGEDSANIAVPGVGYITVPVEATKMLEDKAEKNLEKGLKALNMDVMNEIGLNQSGKAKEMDRTELNDFLQRIADTMYEIHLTNIYYFFTKYMFGVTDPEKVEEIEPQISKPTQFDVYSSTELTAQFADAKKAKLNPSYLGVKQKDIQNKEFSTNPDLLTRLNLELDLDPLAEVGPEDVSLKLSNGTITQETAIIHDNIKEFVDRAMEEVPNFADKKPSEQKAKLMEYAAEVKKATRITIDTTVLEMANQNPTNTNQKFDRKPLIRA